MTHRRAFTLLEMLLATALTALLIGSVMGVASTLAHPVASNTTTTAGEAPPLPIGPLLVMIRDDLISAHSIPSRDGGPFLVVGNMAIDGHTYEHTHRPSVVTYNVHRIAGRHWVVRCQRRLDVLTNEPPQYDLLCAGIRRLRLIRDDQGGKPEHTDGPRRTASSRNANEAANDPAAAPDVPRMVAWRLVMELDRGPRDSGGEPDTVEHLLVIQELEGDAG